LHPYPDLLGNFILSSGTYFQNGIFEALHARPPFSSSAMDYSFPSMRMTWVGGWFTHLTTK